MDSSSDSLREVTVFTNGDSRKLSTWSNVPFFFTETLEARGIRVNRVDISPSPFLKNLYDKTVLRVLGKFMRRTTRDYFRSWLNFIDVRRRIKRAVAAYPDADANLFITFSFSAVGLSDKPLVQFCDWTYDYHFKNFANRPPDFLERLCIRREDSQINGCDLIFPLFPKVAEAMKGRYPGKEIHYNGNVINSLFQASGAEMMERKRNSNQLLFVGSTQYLEGAKALIQAFGALKEKFPLLHIHIIGMKPADFDALPPDVHCHGYLDKSDTAGRELYYQLFRDARVLVNTTPKWGAFSSTIEAMYFHTPVVITPYSEFVETFGREIPFGSYCEVNEPAAIAETVTAVLESPSYEAMCLAAHEAVKDYTWTSYIDRIVTKIEGKITPS